MPRFSRDPFTRNRLDKLLATAPKEELDSVVMSNQRGRGLTVRYQNWSAGTADRREPTKEEYHTGPSAAGRESAAQH